MSRKITFKKYQDNRRLYNETDSTYATILDIVTEVRAGNEVVVLRTKGRGKGDQEETDVTVPMLIDALHASEHERPKLVKGELVHLIQGRPIKLV